MFLFGKRQPPAKSEGNGHEKVREQNHDESDCFETLMKDMMRKLETQDTQYEALRRAAELGDEDRPEEGIAIAERVMYEEEFRCRGVKWPFILSDLYLQTNQYDNNWRYLNYLASGRLAGERHLGLQRVKSLKQEGRHLDALGHMMQHLVSDNAGLKPSGGYGPTQEKLLKALRPYIKRAKLVDREKAIVAIVERYCGLPAADIRGLPADMRSILTERDKDSNG